MRWLPYVAVLAALALAGTAGFLTATAVGQSPPTKTVTVNVATGPPGPAGPQGPAGPPGAEGAQCIAGYSPGILVINHPGGQTRIYTCIEN